MSALRIGLLGCGRIGRVHADSVTVHPRAELARVFDPFEAAATEVAAQFGSTWTTEADAILDDPSIDAVIVASPTPTHVDLLTRALRAGKAVLCEKPIDLDLARVDACRAEIGELDEHLLGAGIGGDLQIPDLERLIRADEDGGLHVDGVHGADPL